MLQSIIFVKCKISVVLFLAISNYSIKYKHFLVFGYVDCPLPPTPHTHTHTHPHHPHTHTASHGLWLQHGPHGQGEPEASGLGRRYGSEYLCPLSHDVRDVLGTLWRTDTHGRAARYVSGGRAPLIREYVWAEKLAIQEKLFN